MQILFQPSLFFLLMEAMIVIHGAATERNTTILDNQNNPWHKVGESQTMMKRLTHIPQIVTFVKELDSRMREFFLEIEKIDQQVFRAANNLFTEISEKSAALNQNGIWSPKKGSNQCSEVPNNMTNLASKQPTFASKIYSSSYDHSMMVDGDYSTYYSSKQDPEAYVAVDLGASRKVYIVILNTVKSQLKRQTNLEVHITSSKANPKQDLNLETLFDTLEGPPTQEVLWFQERNGRGFAEGRYVYILKKKNVNYLSVHELAVLGI